MEPLDSDTTKESASRGKGLIAGWWRQRGLWVLGDVLMFVIGIIALGLAVGSLLG